MNPVFIIGAARSGTTWLQLMIGAHPAIATGQESQLFIKYLQPFMDSFRKELHYPETEKARKHGVSSYISEGELVGQFRRLGDFIYGKAIDGKPGAVVFMDKLTNNRFDNQLLWACYPEASFIHLIRDGRDVTSSMLAAGKSWGGSWAPDSAHVCASEWVDAIQHCRQNRPSDIRYLEVRYESLLDEGPGQLARIFDFIGASCNDEWIAETYRRFTFDKLKSGDYDRDVLQNPGEATASGTSGLAEPSGFFRKGKSGDWQESLSPKQLQEVYWAAGTLLNELGYTGEDLTPAATPGSIRSREFKSGLYESLKRVVKR